MKSYIKPPNKLACFEYYYDFDKLEEYKEQNDLFLRQEKLNNLKEKLPTRTEVMEQRNGATERKGK